MIDFKMHVIGDRQAGKTDMVLAYASMLIANGPSVAVYTADGKYAAELARRYENHAREGQRIYYGNGAQRVEDPSGGTLYFVTTRGQSLRGVRVSTVIVDSVFNQVDDCVIEERHPGVTHLVRTVL